MDQLCSDVVWQVNNMPGNELCVMSLVVTVACYLLLRGAGKAFRL